LRKGAKEERLFAPGSDLAERAGCANKAVILERGLFGRRDLDARSGRRTRLRAAEAFERELAIKLIIMLRRVCKIGIGGLGVACRKRCAPGPVIALRARLRGTGRIAIGAVEAHRLGGAIEMLECELACKPGERRVVVAHAE